MSNPKRTRNEIREVIENLKEIREQYANQRVIEELENAKNKFPSLNREYTDSIFDKLINELKQ